MIPYERFDKLCKEKNVTAYRVAKETGIAQVTLSNWKKGKYSPKIGKLQKIADFFGVSVNYFTGDSRPVPVLADVAAGVPLATYEALIDWEEIESKAGDFYALRIKGDSMSPKIQDGDVVVVRSQPDAETGDIVIAKINGDESCCKRLIKNKEGITLQSLNPDYLPLVFSSAEIDSQPVRILGKVIELRRKF